MKSYFVPITTYCIENEQRSLSKAIHVFLRCLTLIPELLKTTKLHVSCACAEDISKSTYRNYSIL